METTYQFQHLKGLRLKVFQAAGNRIIPPNTDHPGGGGLKTAAMTDWAMGKMAPDILRKFLLLLMVMQILGFFFGGRGFASNTPNAQDRQLRWMEKNRLKLFRMGFFGLATFIEMGYYTREENFPLFNYPGPLFPDTPYADSVARAISRGTIKLLP